MKNFLITRLHLSETYHKQAVNNRKFFYSLGVCCSFSKYILVCHFAWFTPRFRGHPPGINIFYPQQFCLQFPLDDPIFRPGFVCQLITFLASRYFFPRKLSKLTATKKIAFWAGVPVYIRFLAWEMMFQEIWE